MASSSAETSALTLDAVIGFAGDVPEGLILHPDDEHLVYPLGSNVVVKNLLHHTQRFLQKDGHDRSVSCTSLSHNGKMLATGQVSHMGFSAVVIVWDLETGSVIQKLTLHKGKVQALAFSCDDKWLASLGGEDDNKLVIWNIQNGDAVCGNPASNDTALTVKFFNKDPFKLVTGGKYNLRVWQFDLPNRKIRPTDCRLGSLKRITNAIVIDPDDKYMYVGTGSGDLLRVNLEVQMFKDSGPRKKSFANGIRVVTLTHNGDVVVGAGDGTVALLRHHDLGIVRKAKFEGGVTSVALNKAGDHFFIGTNKCNIHLVHLASFDNELRSTCHYGRINDVCFPEGYSELFITASERDIRVWNTQKRTELLRIHVPSLECLCVTLSSDGKSIVSGWSDGKIRAFKPQSGKLMYVIHDAHEQCVSAVAVTHDGTRVVSGGGDGRVRVWSIGNTTRMIASLSEHKGKVTFIRIKGDDSECVSASHDGSCIVWDLLRYLRLNAMFASTQFNTIVYHPDESQLLTSGTDRKITYWDAVDGSAIRIVDGSNAGEITSLDISADGEVFASGSADKLVKLWGYDEGHCYYYGLGHSGAVKRVAIAPDQRHIVSVGAEGAVFIWKFPQETFIATDNDQVAQEEAVAEPSAAVVGEEAPPIADEAAANIATTKVDAPETAEGQIKTATEANA